MSRPAPIRETSTCFRFAGGLFGALLLVGFGCAESVNPISTNRSYGPDDQFATRVLDASERREVLEIMSQSVTGPTDDPARPAKYGVRWDDVLLAAKLACKDVDCAVVSLTEERDGAAKRLEIVTVGNAPVELLVERVPAPEIYRASVTAGLFSDRQALADRLLERFHVAMRAYGAKPGWPSSDR